MRIKILEFENPDNSGGEAKYVISEGRMAVNGTIETRKRKKIVSGYIIKLGDEMLGIRVK